jgi:hypothetical protein
MRTCDCERQVSKRTEIRVDCERQVSKRTEIRVELALETIPKRKWANTGLLETQTVHAASSSPHLQGHGPPQPEAGLRPPTVPQRYRHCWQQDRARPQPTVTYTRLAPHPTLDLGHTSSLAARGVILGDWSFSHSFTNSIYLCLICYKSMRLSQYKR